MSGIKRDFVENQTNIKTQINNIENKQVKKFVDDLETIIDGRIEYIKEDGRCFIEDDEDIIELIEEKVLDIKDEICDDRNVLELIEQKIKQMKGYEKNTEDGKKMRIRTLLNFLIILSACNKDYNIEKEKKLYKILSTLDKKEIKFILYNLNKTEQRHIKSVGAKILKHLRRHNYHLKKTEKILICDTIFPGCSNDCEKPKEIFSNIINDFTYIKEKHPDFFNKVQGNSNLICGNCLSQLPKYERAKKILKGID
ncbi:hypothetical protein [Halonatronum saccharophilum]|uniref:hypothetical protein n=1 Tax=Halonatronum saccharophilum TaxID=150060 RepID=UPI000483C0DE|nr:hypothetical protein [Halonatronum saccharophilum]